MDGTVELKGSADEYRQLGSIVLESDVGLAQVLHPGGGGIRKEFRWVRGMGKDIKSNIEKSLEWFRAQPDYHPDIKVYQNTFLVYDPTNLRYQEVSSFFWSRYSLELDSWRDQPLWAYSLHKFNATPILLYETQQCLFRNELRKRAGFRRHVCSGEAEVAMNQTLAVPQNGTVDGRKG